MNGDMLAICLGVLAAVLYLLYLLWRKRESRRQREQLAQHYGEEEEST